MTIRAIQLLLGASMFCSAITGCDLAAAPRCAHRRYRQLRAATVMMPSAPRGRHRRSHRQRQRHELSSAPRAAIAAARLPSPGVEHVDIEAVRECHLCNGSARLLGFGDQPRLEFSRVGAYSCALFGSVVSMRLPLVDTMFHARALSLKMRSPAAYLTRFTSHLERALI